MTIKQPAVEKVKVIPLYILNNDALTVYGVTGIKNQKKYSLENIADIEIKGQYLIESMYAYAARIWNGLTNLDNISWAEVDNPTPHIALLKYLNTLPPERPWDITLETHYNSEGRIALKNKVLESRLRRSMIQHFLMRLRASKTPLDTLGVAKQATRDLLNAKEDRAVDQIYFKIVRESNLLPKVYGQRFSPGCEPVRGF